MKKVVVPKKVSRFERLIQKENKGFTLGVINIILTIITLLIALSLQDSQDFNPSGFFRFLMIFVMVIQLLPLYGIIIAIIQFIKGKQIKFTIKEYKRILIGLLINTLWLGLFISLIVSVILEINK